MMKREELKEKMENWICNHKKQVVGTAAAAVLTIAVVGGAVYAVNAPVSADKTVAKTEQRKDSRLEKKEAQKEEKKAEEKKAEEKKDAEEKKQEKEKSDKEKEKKQEKKTDNAAAKQTKENTATSSTVTNSEPAPEPEKPAESKPAPEPEKPAESKPAPEPEKPVESKPTPEPEKPVHVHDWQPQYKDKPTYETKVVCGCGDTFDNLDQWDEHKKEGICTLGYSVQEVQTGTTQELSGYKCSCGATK